MSEKRVIEDIDEVTAQQLVDLLSAGQVVEYNGKTLYPPEEDDHIVWGSDAYGCDFGAGDIREPSNVLANLSEQTLSEEMHETCGR